MERSSQSDKGGDGTPEQILDFTGSEGHEPNVDRRGRGRESAWIHCLKLAMDLNAGYCCPHWPCCFSMIRTEGPEALVVKG